MYNVKTKLSFFVLISSISWFTFSFVFNVDSLGGALHDFQMHEKYLFDFSNNFLKTINDFGEKNEVRNSPFFYILFAKLVEFGIDINDLKYFNLVVLFLILYFFNKCLNLKFNQLDRDTRFFLFLASFYLQQLVLS